MMRGRRTTKGATARRIGLCCLVATAAWSPAGESGPPNALVVYGAMHESIGQGRYQGRIALSDVLDQPRFFGVGAVEGLRGEIAILDSRAVVTRVAADGRLQPLEDPTVQATILMGRSVDRWKEVAWGDAIPPEEFDAAVRAAAAASGLDPATPFVFVVEGEFEGVRLHVINGACPLHARLRKLTIPADRAPVEVETDHVHGVLVGVYAEGAVGRLTHPATTIHAHLVFRDPATGREVTGHLEQVGVRAGALLKLPGS